MKKLLLLAFATCFTFAIASAQTPGYFLNYGTPDGSVLSVTINSDIDVPAYYTGPAVGSGFEDINADGIVDSVNFIHMPLASDNIFITSRSGGTLSPLITPPVWDDVSFLAPDLNQPGAGFTSQSVLGFADIIGGPNVLLFTDGAQIVLATYFMHTVDSTVLIDSTRCPFVGGFNPANGGLLMGIQGGLNPIYPLEVFSCIFFSPNNEPVWGPPPVIPDCVDAGIEFCFTLTGTDVDMLDELHINYLGVVGTFTEIAGGPGGYAEGEWCGTLSAGSYDLDFELNDGVVALPLTIPLVVEDIELVIGCPAGIPGAEVWVPVSLNTCVFLTGGFEILVSWDPTALGLIEIVPAARIDYGEEYFNVNLDDACEICPPGGSARVVWISDLNNGIPHAPAAPGTDPIFWLHYTVTYGVPFGFVAPIEFVVEHYSDNTISDETGYLFVHPLLTDGCVNVVDPSLFKGDPNMNGWYYEIADAVLVARRLIEGYIVWSENGTGDDAIQEIAADLNNNGFVDIADLVRFINIINGNINPPKLDPTSEVASLSMPNVVGDEMTVTVRSALNLGGALMTINHTGIELGEPVANGMQVLSHDVDGVMNLVVFSLEGNTIAAGKSSLVTIPVLSNNGGTMEFGEVSAADSYGRLLEATASLVAPLPTEFAVKANYPNPFNAKTMINFDLPKDSDVNINIYSITGQLVETISGQFEAGSRSITWDASDVASGIYFYKVSAGDFSQTMKMTLLK
jgi:hypothetical protein